MPQPTILIIEDNLDLQTLLCFLLTRHGFSIYTASDGEEGLRQFYQQQPDLVLLDLNLPKVDGWEVLRLLGLLAEVPIMIISSQAGKREIARALEVADDYIVKPFSIHELLPRVQTVLTRYASARTKAPIVLPSPTLPSAPLRRNNIQHAPSVARVEIDLAARRVYTDGCLVRLTDIEFRLLECLVKQSGRVLTYQQILAQVWGWQEGHNHHYVHVHISRLRQKLEKDPKNPQHLLTEHGIGYWWRALSTLLFWNMVGKQFPSLLELYESMSVLPVLV